eukprot:Gb_20755 [translate_table: standard]
MSAHLKGVEMHYPILDKKAYALVKVVNKFRHYILENKVHVIMPDPTIKLMLGQNELGDRRGKWMAKLQEFDIALKARPSQRPLSHPSHPTLLQEGRSDLHLIGQRSMGIAARLAMRNDYVDIVSQLADPLMAKEDSLGEYYLRDRLLYRLGLLCMPSGSYRPQMIREAYHSKVAGHFGMKKTISHLHCYFYWPKITTNVERHVRACSLCSISKPSNQKLGKYQPLPVPERPWESISMDFLGGLLTT